MAKVLLNPGGFPSSMTYRRSLQTLLSRFGFSYIYVQVLTILSQRLFEKTLITSGIFTRSPWL